MSRPHLSVQRRARHKTVLRAVRGMRGRKSKCFKLAVIHKRRAEAMAYVGRKLKKRVQRSKWTKIISIWARSHGQRYSTVIAKVMERFGSRKAAHAAIVSLGDDAGPGALLGS